MKNDGSFVLTSGDPVQKPFGKERRQAHEDDDDDDDGSLSSFTCASRASSRCLQSFFLLFFLNVDRIRDHYPI
jgi:hypothetical protein